MDKIKRCECGWKGQLFEHDYKIEIICNICDKKVVVEFETANDVRYAQMDAIDKWNKGEMI